MIGAGVSIAIYPLAPREYDESRTEVESGNIVILSTMYIIFRVMARTIVLVALISAVTPHSAWAQPAVAVDAGIASGGDTNDVQATYGAAVRLWQSSRLSGFAEISYVRDFLEFEPDTRTTDAFTYSGVTAFGGAMRVWLLQPSTTRIVPFVSAYSGALRLATADQSSVHFGWGAGAGLRLFERRRWAALLESRRFSAVERNSAAGFSFWRTTATFEIRLD